MSNKDTVTVNGQDYVFDPEEVTKPEKQEEDNIIYESSGNP